MNIFGTCFGRPYRGWISETFIRDARTECITLHEHLSKMLRRPIHVERAPKHVFEMPTRRCTSTQDRYVETNVTNMRELIRLALAI